MNLDELRTPHPLRESDFAAIRARVRAEIAQREEHPWPAILLRFAFAASLLVLFVPFVRERRPTVPVPVPVPVAKLSAPPAPALPAERQLPAGRSAAFQAARNDVRATPVRTAHIQKAEPPAATRIEIVTADPTIRIIWLTPKENS